ncbi:hypothetical protein TELCIR_10702 [Teladorsagia circumcincta]|uniref:Uncharacterized protein n=1 Tax=Teladorsagia circumcincta TaxID=45464 RepID=A0A2G9UBC2_TELCI|nr:hypothetical protein TELCIR_10702 [Teladorsagia circumcincta]
MYDSVGCYPSTPAKEKNRDIDFIENPIYMSLFSLRKKLSLKKKKESEKVAEVNSVSKDSSLAESEAKTGCLPSEESRRSAVPSVDSLTPPILLDELEKVVEIAEIPEIAEDTVELGATSEWMYAAAGLHERTMFYVLLDSPDYIYELDVRKVTSREEICRAMVEQAQMNKTTNPNIARADGLLVPIHVWERENRPFNVKIDLAAEEVCRKAVARRGFDAPQDGNYAIFEVILSGALSRRLPPFEKLSVSVLDHWLPWQCTDGYLLFDHDNWPYDGNEIEFYTGKVKIAEPGSKTFHSYEVSVEGGVKITACKHDKLWKEWIVADSVFYSGCSANRKAPYAHNVTILEKKTATVTEKLVGYCISFRLMPERTRFLNMIQFIETGGQPPPLVHL